MRQIGHLFDCMRSTYKMKVRVTVRLRLELGLRVGLGRGLSLGRGLTLVRSTLAHSLHMHMCRQGRTVVSRASVMHMTHLDEG